MAAGTHRQSYKLDFTPRQKDVNGETLNLNTFWSLLIVIQQCWFLSFDKYVTVIHSDHIRKLKLAGVVWQFSTISMEIFCTSNIVPM